MNKQLFLLLGLLIVSLMSRPLASFANNNENDIDEEATISPEESNQEQAEAPVEVNSENTTTPPPLASEADKEVDSFPDPNNVLKRDTADKLEDKAEGFAGSFVAKQALTNGLKYAVPIASGMAGLGVSTAVNIVSNSSAANEQENGVIPDFIYDTQYTKLIRDNPELTDQLNEIWPAPTEHIDLTPENSRDAQRRFMEARKLVDEHRTEQSREAMRRLSEMPPIIAP